MTGLSPEMRGVRAIEKEPNTASEGRSADAAVDGAQDEHGGGEHAEEVLVQGIIPLADAVLPAHGDGVLHRLPAPDPGEHDTRQGSAQGTDVDGDEVHPGRDDALDADGDHHTDEAHDGN